MGRPRPEEYEDDAPRRRGRRKDDQEDFDEYEDEAAFEEDVDERPPRRKASAKQKARRAQEEDDEDDDEEDDDPRGKQLVLRKPTKGKGKEVARKKKKQESSDEDEEDDDSSEEERKTKKAAKKKKKARKSEVITKAAWEPVPHDELDHKFVNLIADELGHAAEKILQGAEYDLILRHTETGEYNIDAFFEQGVFSLKDKKRWKQCVDKLKGNERTSRVLFCSSKRSGGPGYGDGYYVHGGRTAYGGTGHAAPGPARGHVYYDPRCRNCREYDIPCAALYDDYGY
ncbi:MAG: hypothetical protein Q9170_002157 [Blastenia crenularia]